jgi:5'-3' exonuclease
VLSSLEAEKWVLASFLAPNPQRLQHGQVYAAGSEDMDTLTFAAPILYRHLTFSEAKKQPISEINLEKALEGLDMNMSQVRSPLRHNTPFD